MNEGEVFNTEALKMSIKRINQLGYFKRMEGAPDIRPSEKADNKVDVTEYYFDVFGPLRLLLFFDAGQAYAEGQGFYWKTMSTSTGVEARFTMPVLNVPFRLIYAWNPNRDFYHPPHAFKFAVGTTF